MHALPSGSIARQDSFPLLNSNARVIAYLMAKTSEGVEQRRFARVRIAHYRNKTGLFIAGF